MAKKKQLSKQTWLIIAAIIVLAIMVLSSGEGGALAKFSAARQQIQPTAVSSATIIDAKYDHTTTTLTLFIQNTGNTKLPLNNAATFPMTTWILKENSGVARCSSNWACTGPARCLEGCGSTKQIAIGQISKVVLNLDDECNINPADYGEIFSFIIDFSGKTTATGSFPA